MRAPYPRAAVRIPGMTVVIGGDRALFDEQSGYAIDRQGKPPDFVLEVASPTTGIVDYTAKRMDYARFGISEYWRFDSSGGRFHDTSLAGDKLVDGKYIPIGIMSETNERFWGYSPALGVELWWYEGMLRFRDPATGQFLGTPEEIDAAYQDAESRAVEAEARADESRAAKEAAEVRLVEMEAELRRLRGG